MLCNKKDEEIVIPKAVQLGVLYNASVVREVEQDELSVENRENPVDVDWTSLSPGERTDLECLLEKHHEVFSAHDQDFGFTDKVSHRIDTSGAQPFKERHRPLPPTLGCARPYSRFSPERSCPRKPEPLGITGCCSKKEGLKH